MNAWLSMNTQAKQTAHCDEELTQDQICYTCMFKQNNYFVQLYLWDWFTAQFEDALIASALAPTLQSDVFI